MKLIKQYMGHKDITIGIEKSHFVLSTATQMLTKRCSDEKKGINPKSSEHHFQIGNLVLVKKCNKANLELKWEP